MPTAAHPGSRLPLQGIGKSISRFTLEQGGKKTAYRVTLTIENPGRTAK